MLFRQLLQRGLFGDAVLQRERGRMHDERPVLLGSLLQRDLFGDTLLSGERRKLHDEQSVLLR